MAKRPDDRKKQKQKKKRGGGLLLLLILLLLLLALLGGLGFGLGWFDGDGKSSGDSNDSKSSSVDRTVEDSSAADKDVVSITVKGSDYEMNGKTMTLEEVKTELGSFDKTAVTVEITDEEAIEGAYKSLTDALDELGFKHT